MAVPVEKNIFLLKKYCFGFFFKLKIRLTHINPNPFSKEVGPIPTRVPILLPSRSYDYGTNERK
jgi:hypothetical protein